jgi:8-amino-7-oxononanoate synthase
MQMKEWFLNTLMEELADLDRRNRLRSLPPLEVVDDVHAEVKGRRMLLFSANSYLGLSSDKRLRDAVARTLDSYPMGSGAARLISGNTSRHERLERKCAELKSCEAAVLFSTGYMANLGVISSLARQGDLIFSDAFNHASVVDGCRLSKAQVKIFRHKDYCHLEELLKENIPKEEGQAVIVTDGVFSMDGDVPDLKRIGELAKDNKALVVVDDAHGTGVLGPRGGGVAEEQSAEEVVDVFVGTLGKALGCFGAFAAGKKVVIDWLLNKSRPFIFTTSLPVSIVAAAEVAIDIAVSEEWRRERLQKLSKLVFREISSLGRGIIGQSRDGSGLRPFTPIIPFIVGEDGAAQELSMRLQKEGQWVPAIRPPSVPEHTARLRITLSAAHTDNNIEKLLEVLYKHSRAMGICA